MCDKTCKTCRHWDENANLDSDNPNGQCFLSIQMMTDSRLNFATKSEFFVSGRRGMMTTGPDFGCIHHQQKLTWREVFDATPMPGAEVQEVAVFLDSPINDYRAPIHPAYEYFCHNDIIYKIARMSGSRKDVGAINTGLKASDVK